MQLSDRAIRAIKPTPKHQYIADGNGLYLRVQPTGTKTWLYRSRIGGKARWTTLGDYPTLSLLDARRRALEYAGAVAPETVSFGTAYEEYYRRVAVKQYARPDIIAQRVEANLLPSLRNRSLGLISQVDLVNLLHVIVDRGSPVMANRTLADIKHIFGYAVERGWLKASPAEKITRKVIGGPETSCERALSTEELHTFIHQLRGGAGKLAITTRMAFGLLLLTGQRAGEVLGMHESEIEGVWWRIPAARMKKSKRANPSGKPHMVYLSPPARLIWKLATERFGPRPFSSDHRVLSHALRRLQEALEEDQRFTPHDLRRTMATRLSDLGVAPHVVEKMLNHQMPGVMAVYNRAEYLPERRAAWRLWGRELTRLRRTAPAP